MRNFKFRAWHKKAKEMLYEINPGDVFHWKFEGQPIEIMQFTGLKDINRKEIYEGDIVKTYYENPFSEDTIVIGIISYRETESYYEIDFPKYGYSQALCQFTEQEITILGNEYENPEIEEI